jgi:hypothetical protein
MKAEDRKQTFVNTPDLLSTGVPDRIPQTGHVHGSDLFDEYPRRHAFHDKLWSE